MEQKNQNSLAKPTLKLISELTKKTNKFDLIRKFNHLTIDNIIDSNCEAISILKKEYTENHIEQLTGILVMDLNESFKKTLKEDEIEEISIEITNSYLSNLSFEDLFLCFKNIKRTNQYGDLSINKILTSLNDYFETKTSKIEQINYNKHLSTKFTGNSYSESEKNRVKKLMDNGMIDLLKNNSELK